MNSIFLIFYLMTFYKNYILSFNYFIKNDLLKFDNLLNINNTGYDYRFILNENINSNLYNINKKKIFDDLINPNLGTLQKIDIINNNDLFDNHIKGFNIYNGGLFNNTDFNNDFTL